MEEIHFFDLDNTLINVKNYIWIIDKESPGKLLGKIGNREFSLIKNNFYKKDNLQINYNGEKFFISKELFDKIRRKKKIPLERIGLSFREWTNQKYINNSKVTFLTNNIKHLSGRDVKIAFLTARPDRLKHSRLLNSLRYVLKKFYLKIYKIYFIGDKFEIYHKEYLSHRKSVVLLEHLIGLKIKNDKFIPYKQDKFSKVYFYDDEKMNIDSANDIQELFNKIYSHSDEEIKKIINKRLKDKPILCTNLVSNNEVKPFKTNIINLQLPIRFPIIESIKKFNDFDFNL